MANYEYGKRYNPCGERPDLPDDTWIKAQVKGKLSCTGRASEYNWGRVEWFEIYDRRFENSVMPMVPPAATPCPAIGSKMRYNQETVEIIAHDETRPQVAVRHSNGELSVLQLAWIKPLPTPHEELIEAVADVLSRERFEENLEEVVESLHDAGLLAQPADQLLTEFCEHLSNRCDLSVANEVAVFLRQRGERE